MKLVSNTCFNLKSPASANFLASKNHPKMFLRNMITTMGIFWMLKLTQNKYLFFTQFTNIIQEVRVNRNWTNYFELVRDGLTSMSDRVREDSHWDMATLVYYSTYAQRALLLADPLLDSAFKNLLINEPDYGFPELEEPQPQGD